MVKKVLVFLVMLTLIISNGSVIASIVADHAVVAEFNSIPDSIIEQIYSQYQFYYGHTSHGSQIVTGLNMLEDDDIFNVVPSFVELSDDLGHNGDTTWAPITRNYLSSHPEIDVVIWSWCGGVSDNTANGINLYLSTYNQLEIDYPAVTFIYMTGHLDGGGVDGNLYQMNDLIRDYCLLNNKVLFDFADIESYDPDGNYYPDEDDICNWCTAWCSTHSCLSCGGCAHSHCFNCSQKGKAFWWMMAKVVGWEVEIINDCGDVDNNGFVNILDITFLIDYLYKSGPAPESLLMADVNSSGNINILDVTYLIAYLYKSGPDPFCIE